MASALLFLVVFILFEMILFLALSKIISLFSRDSGALVFRIIAGGLRRAAGGFRRGKSDRYGEGLRDVEFLTGNYDDGRASMEFVILDLEWNGTYSKRKSGFSTRL